MAFNGLSNLSTVATWSFTTRAAPTLSAGGVTVDGSQSSTANFRTVEGALNALATGLPGATAVTINVAAGTYNELVRYTGPGAAAPQTITILGPAGNNRGDGCVIQFSNGNALNGSTQTRASAYFAGANVVLQNITLRNTAVRSVLAQAESLYFASGTGFTLAADNSSFYGNQDTIQTSGRNWFYNCYIEGNVDFIWGTADAALFEGCSLRFINDLGAAASFSLFVARTGTTIAAGGDGTVGKGYVLLNSEVSVDANVTATFGRDAGTGAYYDQAALINVVFSGLGTIGAGIWNVTTAPLSLGDSSYVGWKSAGCSGLNLATAVTDPKTSAIIASQATEYDTRDHILNRVVTVTAGVPSGFQAATSSWDVSSLATAWGAPSP
jgi:pectate lyase